MRNMVGRVTNVFTRRHLLRIGGGALAGAGLLGLSGCGSDSGGSSDGADLRATFWSGDQAFSDSMQKGFKTIEAQRPDIRVSAQFGPFNGYFDKLNTQIAGGNAPDIMRMADQLSQYADRGVLLDLEQFVGDAINLDDWDETQIAQGRWEGKLVGLTDTSNVHAVIYNAALLNEINVEIPGDEWTMDDLADFATEVAQTRDGDFWGTVDSGGNLSLLQVMYVRPNGKELYADGGRLGFQKEDLIAWLTYWDELRAAGAAPPGEVSAAGGGPDSSLLVKGQCPLILGTFSNLLPQFKQLIDSELELHVVPTAAAGSRPGSFVRPGTFWSASARTDHPEESAFVMNALINNPDIASTLGQNALTAPSKRVRDAAKANADDVQLKGLEFFDMVSSRYTTPLDTPPPPGDQEIRDLLDRANEDIAFKRIRIDEAVDGFFAGAETVLGQQ